MNLDELALWRERFRTTYGGIKEPLEICDMAERYMWLRDKANSHDGPSPLVWACDHNGQPIEHWTSMLHGEQLDAAIDAARKAIGGIRDTQ